MKDSTIHIGDCREVLAGMDPGSVHCCVTSPPYWGLRDYGTASWEGGDEGCDHVEIYSADTPQGDGHTQNSCRPGRTAPPDRCYGKSCLKCGARRIDAQLGLEPTPDAYLATMVDVFRAVKRVLRDDGTCWVNMGDGYAMTRPGACAGDGWQNGKTSEHDEQLRRNYAHRSIALPAKNLIGMPWRLALALQSDGWYLRSDIIWAKPNPMPESVTDRPTKSHEHVFLMTQQPRYFYDAEAVREKHKEPHRGQGEQERNHWSVGDNNRGGEAFVRQYNPNGRNLRDVWTIPTEAYAEAHFATYPRKLVEPCIKAGTSDKGCCPECGVPWRRKVEGASGGAIGGDWKGSGVDGMRVGNAKKISNDGYQRSRTVGWEPGCECETFDTAYGFDVGKPHPCSPVPATVLDPFAGSGTTGVVATQLGRRFVGIELNQGYAEMARRRIANPEPLSTVKDVVGQELLDFVSGSSTHAVRPALLVAAVDELTT